MAAPDSPSRPAERSGPARSGIHFQDEVQIRRELAHVFEFVSDGERLPAWMAGVKRARRTSPPGPIGPGTTYRVVGKLLGRRVESRYELTDYEPAETFSARMVSPFFELEETYRFDESDGATKLTLTGWTVPLGRLKLLGPFLFLAMQRQVRTDHGKLKSVLERSHGRRPATAVRSSSPASQAGHQEEPPLE